MTMLNKLKVELMQPEGSNILGTPEPAAVAMPGWYKQIPAFVDRVESDVLTHGAKNETAFTIKRCIPFLDSMTDGFVLRLKHDIKINRSSQGIMISGEIFKKIDFESAIGTHPKLQIPNMPVAKEYYTKSALKWINHCVLKTPPGYSISFDHPSNRTDLPFITLSGIVDTDTFTMPVNFPFFIREDFSGIIPAGTPVVQFSIFKRESWEIEKTSVSRLDTIQAMNEVAALQPSAYKNNYWHKKKK